MDPATVYSPSFATIKNIKKQEGFWNGLNSFQTQEGLKDAVHAENNFRVRNISRLGVVFGSSYSAEGGIIRKRMKFLLLPYSWYF